MISFKMAKKLTEKESFAICKNQSQVSDLIRSMAQSGRNEAIFKFRGTPTNVDLLYLRLQKEGFVIGLYGDIFRVLW